jgi:hypothetical protein
LHSIFTASHTSEVPLCHMSFLHFPQINME